MSSIDGTPATIVEVVAPGGPPGPQGPQGPPGPPTSLVDLTDVTGTPAPGLSPVYDNTGIAPLTAITTQQDLDAILAQVVWHKVQDITADPWQPSNTTAVLTPDGVTFGPYADGSAAGASLRYLGLNGQPFNAVRNLAYNIRYRSDDEQTDPGEAPYCRIFTTDSNGDQHDACYTPGSQLYTGLGPGPMQELVATAGMWRWDDDSGIGGVPLTDLQQQYGDQTIIKITITVGFTAGVNLVGLLRWWQINGDHLVFGSA
jgi:hypothetical protein